MGRRPCCSKEGVTRGPWTVLEDNILAGYIRVHGEGKWRSLPIRAGLNRCGKSCRLRWLNYLRPDIKRGNISQEEEDLIIRLHNLLGNRWSLIAGRLPGRTDNEIKNYWNTHLAKKTTLSSSSSAPSGNPKITISPTPTPTPGEKMKKKPNDNNDEPTIISPTQLQKPIRTKPTKRTTGVLFPPLLPHLPLDDHCITSPSMIAAGKEPIRATINVPSSARLLTPEHDGSRSIGGNKDNEDDEHALLLDQPIFDEDWVADFFNEMEENVTGFSIAANDA